MTTVTQVNTCIAPATLDFLKDLERHNDRDRFLKNKDRYQAAQANVATFTDAPLVRMRKHDRLSTDTGKEAKYRIYTDTRFHKGQATVQELVRRSFSAA